MEHFIGKNELNWTNGMNYLVPPGSKFDTKEPKNCKEILKPPNFCQLFFW